MNPLQELREEMTYEQMADKAGLSLNTIYQLKEMDADRLLKVRVGTFVTIKKNLGVDLAKYINY